jgi:hypothetical protein
MKMVKENMEGIIVSNSCWCLMKEHQAFLLAFQYIKAERGEGGMR